MPPRRRPLVSFPHTPARMARHAPPIHNRSWIRDQFVDHPKYAEKAEEAYSGTKSTRDKWRLFCRCCLEHNVNTIRVSEETEVKNGTRQEARTREMVVLDLFSVPQAENGRKWTPSNIDTMRNHLRTCIHVPPAIREKADMEKQSGSPRRAGSRYSSSTSRMSPSPYSRPPSFHVQTPSGSFQSPYALGVPTSSSQISDNNPYDQAQSLLSSSGSSLAPSDSASVCLSQPRRSRRAKSHMPSHLMPTPLSPDTWTDARQRRFEERLVRLTASAGLPLSWVENPEWLAFCTEFLPQAKSPSRKVLTRRLLPQTLKEFQSQAKRRVAGKNATASCDGWTGENFHHYIAFMAVVGKEVHTVRVHDASAERKTADNLFQLMVDVIEELRSQWDVNVVAFTTDASGESRKARKMLLARFPHLVCPDCYAHQINLVVGDYFATNVNYITYSKAACELITWLRSKTYILAQLKEVQVQSGNHVRAVIRAVLTRWTAHYLAFSRLLELQHPLKVLVSHDAMAAPDKKILVPSGGSAANKRKAREMIATIEDPVFWHSLARIKTHLEPLARAANLAQAAFCRLDQILLTFGSLCMYYDNLRTKDPADRMGCTAIIDSIEKRWAKADQEVFIAAVILNPFIKISPFSRQTRLLTRAGILLLLKRLYTRFFSSTEQADELQENLRQLYSNLDNYFENKGIFSDLSEYAIAVEDEAKSGNCSPDPVVIYTGLSIPNEPPPPLFKLAFHILSICPNSASCERLFSVFGNTLTKLRNRLGTDTLTSLAELKMHIRDEHVRSKETKERMKRFFGATTATTTNAASTSAPSPVDLQPPATLEQPLVSATDSEIMDLDLDPSLDPAILQASDDTRNDFGCVVDSFVRLTKGDEDNEDTQTSEMTIQICQLFDFGSSHWVSQHERSASRSLDEELELYELLDMDAAGEEDVNLEIDHTLDSVLHV